MTDRRRNNFVLLIVAGLVVLSLLVIVGIPGAVKPKKTRLGLDLKGGVELIYQGKPTAQSKVDAESLNRAIDIMRKRVDQLGVAQPEIQRSGPDEIDVALPGVGASQAQEEVGKTAQLFFYDWEPNVIGADGKPAPAEASATGGPNAGAAQYGLVEYQAVLRAAKRPRDSAQERHDTGAGLHAAAGERVHLRQLVSARHDARKGASRARGNRTEPVRGQLQTAAGGQDQGGARQPRDRARAGAAGRKRERQGHAVVAEQLVRDQRRSGADRLGRQEPAAELRRRRRGHGCAERHLRLHLARAERLPAGHQGNRPPRPGSPASRRSQGSRAAALRGRARRPADNRPVDRLHEVSGRDRHHHRL